MGFEVENLQLATVNFEPCTFTYTTKASGVGVRSLIPILKLRPDFTSQL